MRQEVFSITTLKGICAILVVLIHTHLVGKMALVPFYRCAVPIFFINSGYFLMSSDAGWHREKMGRYIKRMLNILVVADIIYILLSYFVFQGYNQVDLDKNRLFNVVLMEIAFGGQFCGPLWYITAYIQTLIILKFWRLKMSDSAYCEIIGVLLLANLILGSYDFLLPFDVGQPYANRNVLTSALPFVMIGGYLKKHESKIKRMLPKTILPYLLLVIVCYGELCVLYLLKSRDGDIFVMTPVLSIIVFIWFIKHPQIGAHSWINTLGREYSLNIYIFHTMVIGIVGIISNALFLNIRQVEFLIVLPLTIGLCVLIKFLQQKYNSRYNEQTS